MINRWQKLEDLLRETEFVVEASGFEQQTLWERFAIEAVRLRPTDRSRIDWQEQTRGFIEQLGELDNRPVNITIFGCLLNGHPVLFYDAVSHGTRRAHCDAMNFHHCLEVVRR